MQLTLFHHLAVEVHGLVRLARQRHVALALEARDLDAEHPHEPPVQTVEHLRVQHHAVANRLEQRRIDLLERPASRSTISLTKKVSVWSTISWSFAGSFRGNAMEIMPGPSSR